jgi:hypothetical protein
MLGKIISWIMCDDTVGQIYNNQKINNAITKEKNECKKLLEQYNNSTGVEKQNLENQLKKKVSHLGSGYLKL